MTIRKTFVFQLKPGNKHEYKRRHDELWPEMKEFIKENGVHNYSISILEETNQLFGYAEIESVDKWNRMAESDVSQRWWKYMSDIMEPNDSNSGPICSDLRELFYLK